MLALRSALYFLLFYPGTVVYCVATLAVAPFGSGPVQRVVHGWADFHHWLVTRLLRIRFVIEGEMPAGPYLVAVKHQAMVETIEVLRLVDTPVVVMKQQYVKTPLLGPVMRRYGVIGVDREAGASALREMMQRGKQAIADGRPVVIFPEGTRVPVGEAPELRPGFAGLYRALGLPVVPVAHDSGRLWPKGFIKRPGVINVRIGEVIPAGLKRDAIETRVHAAINDLRL
ncbi:lysophospholipid acyltransferase family protein [Sphingomonas astaxanthinifaciens]|uniref:1-acyl-sn-glycerol-3-phosphate acyltransferase n=1 Tax=Sphingomonas astaxanthinifaciens DSM 22298 TaxID=1123267 RepID=A0ABQ5Z474_9SPHN|nr:lysophospholipid acyltransferase family protein [Sphingomonas astaxanthinifaciens]GLR46806.1 1-acyl-sn-glycerol-3-phosphate acyltransferase [Sphingomonas astaxanthinifaciens DSM 22298]